MWKGTYFIPTTRVDWNCSSHNGNLIKPKRKWKKDADYNDLKWGHMLQVKNKNNEDICSIYCLCVSYAPTICFQVKKIVFLVYNRSVHLCWSYFMLELSRMVRRALIPTVNFVFLVKNAPVLYISMHARELAQWVKPECLSGGFPCCTVFKNQSACKDRLCWKIWIEPRRRIYRVQDLQDKPKDASPVG